MIKIGLESASELKSAVATLAEIARSLALPVTAFGDPLSCELGQTAELLGLWQGIDDPQAQAQARVLSAMRMAGGRYGATAEWAEPEPDPVA